MRTPPMFLYLMIRHPTSSRPSSQKIKTPTPPHVRPLSPAVLQDLGIGAACIFEGVGENGHPLESAFVVDRLGEVANRALVPGQPRGVEGDGPERVAEDTTGQTGLVLPFRGLH